VSIVFSDMITTNQQCQGTILKQSHKIIHKCRKEIKYYRICVRMLNYNCIILKLKQYYMITCYGRGNCISLEYLYLFNVEKYVELPVIKDNCV